MRSRAFRPATRLLLAAAVGAWALGPPVQAQDAPGHDMSGHDMAGHDMAGMAGMAGHDMAAPAPAKASGPVLYTADDLAFVHHMMIHHQQAVEMSALMEGRTERADLLRFGRYIADAQQAESAAMQGMLDMAADRGLPLPTHMMHGDPPMAGMLSSAEMKALAAAHGAEFERLWLQGMIFHHEGGLAMARAQELRQALEGRRPQGLDVMVDDILSAQRGEVTKMQAWLNAWGLAAAGDRRAPDVEVATPAPGSAVRAGVPVTLIGVAVDDTAVAAVQVAVHDLSADRWLRRDGSWGMREMDAAERIGASGPASTAWRLVFTPPTAGRYAVMVEAQDTAGKRTLATEPWTLDVR